MGRNLAMSSGGVLLALAAMLAGCGDGEQAGRGEPRTILLGHILTDKHPVHKAMVRMGELVDEKTDGQLTLDIRHSGQVGAEKELIQKTQAGQIQMTKVSSNALESIVDEMGIFTLPFLFRDEAHYWAVLDGPVGQEILGKLEQRGLKGLVYYDAGARSFYANFPITGIESLQGKSIRVQESKTMQSAIRALGARPVDIPFGAQLTQALQKGTRVQGAENNPPSYFNQGHWDPCPHYYLDGHSRAPDVLVMNLDVWNALSEGEQQALLAAARESAEYQKQLWDAEVERIYGELEQRGVEITYDVDVQPFMQAVQPVYDGMSPERQQWVRQIRDVQTAPAHAPATQPAAGP